MAPARKSLSVRALVPKAALDAITPQMLARLPDLGAPPAATDSASPPRIPANGSTVPLALQLVDDSPYQPRIAYDAAELDLLAGAMVAAGQQDPVVVRQVGLRFELIAGHRRVRAARSLGWQEIKAIVVRKTDAEAELATMVHNEGRASLCDYEKAKVYRQALERGFAKTQEQLAALFATTQTVVSRRLAMLELPAPLLALLEARPDLFTYKAGTAIAGLLKAYPEELALVVEAVERLRDGAAEGSINAWVLQKLKLKAGAGDAQAARQKVVANASGRQFYTARLKGRVVTLRLNDPAIDAEEFLKRVVALVRPAADE